MFSRLSVLSLAVLCGACNAPALTAGLGGAQLRTRGNFGATDSGTVVTSNMDSLGLAQRTDVVLPRLFLRDGPRQLELSGFAVDIAGHGTVDADITIGGTTLTANTEVDSTFAMGCYSSVLTWDVARFGSTLLGMGVGVEWIDLDVSMRENPGTLAIASSQAFPLPLMGVRLSSETAPVAASVSVGWIGLNAPSTKASVLDVDARIDGTLIGRPGGLLLQGMLGYRGFEMDVSYDDGGSQVEADFKIGGPYAGLRLRF
ncbi:MAG: hypothetical protein R3F33_04490 [Planctomycetota bacterium]